MEIDAQFDRGHPYVVVRRVMVIAVFAIGCSARLHADTNIAAYRTDRLRSVTRTKYHARQCQENKVGDHAWLLALKKIRSP